MPAPTERQSSTIKSILVGISVMIIGTILLYFLRFFGLTLKAKLQQSISQASNSELYTNTILILAICLFGLSSFMISFFLTRKDYEEIQRKKLGVFVLDELERTKQEHQELLKRPKPKSEAEFAEMREHGEFLKGQDEMLMRISQYIKPPESK